MELAETGGYQLIKSIYQYATHRSLQIVEKVFGEALKKAEEEVPGMEVIDGSVITIEKAMIEVDAEEEKEEKRGGLMVQVSTRTKKKKKNKVRISLKKDDDAEYKVSRSRTLNGKRTTPASS